MRTQLKSPQFLTQDFGLKLRLKSLSEHTAHRLKSKSEFESEFELSLS